MIHFLHLMPHKFITSTAEPSLVREETFMGRDHLVVPVIALTEMVLQGVNSDTPELALEEEFSKNVQAWNGNAIVVNHPQIDGEMVSANSPVVSDSERIGTIFNAQVGDKKLKVEAWIDMERVNALGGEIEETVERLKEGAVEVSTGLYANVEDKEGEYEGKEYSGIWRNIVPDHLALLSEGKTGACSIEDGCGAPRANEGCSCEGEGKCKACEVKNHKSLFSSIKDTLLRFCRQSDTDKRGFLNAALKEKYGGDLWLSAVYDDTLVYEMYTYEEGWQLLERGYSVESDGSVTFDDEATPVVAEVDFVPIKVNDRSTDMDKEKFVDKLIGNEKYSFDEEDREWLMAMSDEHLGKLEVMEGVSETSTSTSDIEYTSTTTSEKEEEEEEVSVEAYLESAPPEVREVLDEALRTQEAKREGMIKTIHANAKNTISEETLRGMSMEVLESMSKLAEKEDYSGRGSVRTQTATEEEAPPSMPSVFEKKVA